MNDTITSGNNNISPAGNSATRSLAWLKVALVGGSVGLLVALGITFALRPRTPSLTATALAGAEQRWRDAQVRDYDLELEVMGAQPARYAVEVRGGEAISAERNGIAVSQRRVWETWTVPGMFDTLASDVATLEKTDSLVVRCTFDERTGVPTSYQRVEMGTGQQVEWKVTRFDVDR